MTPSVLIVLGPSGVGKSSVIDMVRDLDPSLAAVRAYTTRLPRAVDSYRISVTAEEFDVLRRTDLLLAENEIFGVRYGTSRHLISRALAGGQSVIADCPVDSVWSYQAAFPGRVFSAYIEPPSLEVLRYRLSDGRDADGSRWAAARAELARLENGALDDLVGMRVINVDGDTAGTAAQVYAGWLEWQGKA